PVTVAVTFPRSVRPLSRSTFLTYRVIVSYFFPRNQRSNLPLVVVATHELSTPVETHASFTGVLSAYVTVPIAWTGNCVGVGATVGLGVGGFVATTGSGVAGRGVAGRGVGVAVGEGVGDGSTVASGVGDGVGTVIAVLAEGSGGCSCRTCVSILFRRR